MEITDSIKYVGVNDKEIDLFEGQYVVPNGMAYNSYVVVDEEIIVFDSVDARFSSEWLTNIDTVLAGKTPDYFVVQHVEPDHSGSITAFMEKYPNAKVVSSQKCFAMMKNFYGTEYADNRLVVGEGTTLCTGEHEFVFVTAPMVHWPEVIVTFDKKDGVLFSADAFGKFGALDADEDWACEARRYYFGIVGKYGVQAQALLKKASGLDIKTICPLHGPILTENLGYYLDLYNTWTTYGVETKGVVIAYTSVYGNTKKAVLKLADMLTEKGVRVTVADLARDDMAEAVEDAFRHDRLVLATTTYNGEIFPFMRTFIDHLTERNFQNRTVAFIENGSWSPMATKVMKGMLEKCKNITYAENNVKILSALNEESEKSLIALAEELSK